MPLENKDILIDLLEGLSDDDSLPPNQKTISFHTGNGKNNEITVSIETTLGMQVVDFGVRYHSNNTLVSQ